MPVTPTCRVPIVSLDLLVERHDDGCIILTGRLFTPHVEAEIYHHYREPTSVGEILTAVAGLCDCVESGEEDSEELEEQLELPFDRYSSVM